MSSLHFRVTVHRLPPIYRGDLGFIEDPPSVRLEGLNSGPVNASALACYKNENDNSIFLSPLLSCSTCYKNSIINSPQSRTDFALSLIHEN